MPKRPNAIPGGGKWPASKISSDGTFARADLHMKAKNLTWVKGDRDIDTLDDTSRKNLAGGRKPHLVPGGGGAWLGGPDTASSGKNHKL